jgi:hypothetical protein
MIIKTWRALDQSEAAFDGLVQCVHLGWIKLLDLKGRFIFFYGLKSYFRKRKIRVRESEGE